MFQMKDVGRKIAARRKEMDMTQMELADAMGVSFQAVSNWERGNSMPDIGKLPELASLLDLSIDALLTDEQPARLVQHIIQGDEKDFIREEAIRPVTIAQVAPILKPQQTENLLEATIQENEDSVSIDDLVSVAPFVSDHFLHEWALKIAHIEDIHALAKLAPFLEDETLDHLVEKLGDGSRSLHELMPLAPFLGEATLNGLAARCVENANLDELLSIAPFLSEETLDALTARLNDNEPISPKQLARLAPFLPQQTLQRFANDLVTRYGIQGLKDIAPFL